MIKTYYTRQGLSKIHSVSPTVHLNVNILFEDLFCLIFENGKERTDGTQGRPTVVITIFARVVCPSVRLSVCLSVPTF